MYRNRQEAWCCNETITAMEINLIQNSIVEVRGIKVMLDFDLAEIYGTETKVLNQAVKRNIDRFPKDFMFRLTAKEWKQVSLQDNISFVSKDNRSQIVTGSQKHRSKSVMPHVFTEHGVAMLASVLKSKRAIKMNIAIVRAFIALRQFAANYDQLAKEITELRDITSSHNIQLNPVYDALENLMDEKADVKKWEDRERIGFKPNK